MTNRAKITKETRSRGDLEVKQAHRLVKQAGCKLEPSGSRYMGSAVVHYYERGTTSHELAIEQTKEYQFVTQILVDKIDEGFADVGHKQLRIDLMDTYGRKQPRSRIITP